VKSEQQVAVVVHHSNRLRLSIAGTAAVALAALPLAISPVNAARASQGSASTIGAMEPLSNASLTPSRSEFKLYKFTQIILTI
jgi:hypothetical protein